MIEWTLAALAAAQLMPAPPVVITTRMAPLAVAQPMRTRLAEIEVTAGRQMLWTGSLRIGRNGSSSFSRNQTEAVPDECQPADPSNASGSVRSSLSVNLSSYRADRSTVQVEWTRPAASCDPSADDGEGTGTRTVQLNQQVDLSTGRLVTVTGDAGLVIRLTAR